MIEAILYPVVLIIAMTSISILALFCFLKIMFGINLVEQLWKK